MRGLFLLVAVFAGVTPLAAETAVDWQSTPSTPEGTTARAEEGHEAHGDAGEGADVGDGSAHTSHATSPSTVLESASQPAEKIVYVTKNVKVTYHQPTKVLTVYRQSRRARQYYAPSRAWVREVLRKERVATTARIDRAIAESVAPVRALAQQALDSAQAAGGTANLALTEARTAQTGVNGLRKDVKKLRDEKDTARAIWIVFGGIVLVAIVGFGLVLVSGNRRSP